jgi:hypothetical protein
MADPYQARGRAQGGGPAGRTGTRVPSGGSGSIRWPVRDAQAALIRRYVQVGVVRPVWRDFPCMDGQSFRAAVAARAAGMQGKFWALHGYLLTCQPAGEPAGLRTDAYLRSVAKRIGRAREGEPHAQPRAMLNRGTTSETLMPDTCPGEGMYVSQRR